MAREEENTKAAIDNSDSNEGSTCFEDPIEVCCREIIRLEELSWTLDKYFLNQPNKELLALDLWELLEEYPEIKTDIEHYIHHRLEQLRTSIDEMATRLRYYKKIIEQRLNDIENGQ